MTKLQEALSRLDIELRRYGVRAAVVGGMAVSLRLEPRTTEDVDLAVATAGDAEAEKIVAWLRSRGYREIPYGIMDQEDTGRLAAVRLQRKEEGGGGVVVDLLFASSGIEPEIVAAAEPLEILPGFRMPVASRAHLLALKALAGRPKDLIDFTALAEAATDHEIEEAREALELISRRGYDRRKDLVALFDRYLHGDLSSG